MTEDLYRKEALEHRSRSLYGEVILSAPPGAWLVTFILAAVMICLGGLLWFGQVQTDTGPMSVLFWLFAKAS